MCVCIYIYIYVYIYIVYQTTYCCSISMCVYIYDAAIPFPHHPTPPQRVWVYRSRGSDDPRPPLWVGGCGWVGAGGYVTMGVIKWDPLPAVPVGR